MTSTTLPFGAAVREATVFLDRVHEELWELIRSLDTLMAAQRWSPPDTTAVTHGLGNGLGANSWVVRTIWRVYAPAKEMKADRLQRLSICEFALAPPEHTEALCICVSAQFAKPSSFAEFWDNWDWSVPSPFGTLPTSANRQQIPPEVLDQVFSAGGVQARGTVLPLASIRNEEGLITSVVPNLLAPP
jgi:hypothetical protein